MKLAGTINRYIRHWFIKRSGYRSEEITLNGKILYILPTQYGVFFSLVILAMLIGSINYENSMGFMLTFLMVGLMGAGMLNTYHNLISLKIKPLKSTPVFCGELATFELSASLENHHQRYAIHYGNNRKNYNTIDITDNNQATLTISTHTVQRGYLFLEPVRIWSHFPLGLFHAWSWVQPALRTIVYPKPYGNPLSLSYFDNTSTGVKPHNNTQDDYSGLRKYLSGDSPKHIAWKAVAKGHDLYTKQYSGQNSGNILLDWYTLDNNLNNEEKLSQLCLWVLQASQENLNYGLRIPNKTLKPANGEAHKAKCLTALALYPS